MSDNVTHLLIAAVISGSLFGLFSVVAVMANADELARAWIRLNDWWQKRGGP